MERPGNFWTLQVLMGQRCVSYFCCVSGNIFNWMQWISIVTWNKGPYMQQCTDATCSSVPRKSVQVWQRVLFATTQGVCLHVNMMLWLCLYDIGCMLNKLASNYILHTQNQCVFSAQTHVQTLTSMQVYTQTHVYTNTHTVLIKVRSIPGCGIANFVLLRSRSNKALDCMPLTYSNTDLHM